MIKTENLTKEYNGKKAVDNLNLEVGDGEVFGFLGPNGAGKSTTILMLAGMIEPTSGSCTVDGINVALDPLKGKEILGYLPEDVGFYRNLTGYENLDYLGKFYPITKSEREERIETLLKSVRLNDVPQKVGEYSRGMNQRLGLALALLNDPKVIILDEPTANLDPEGVLRYREIIKELEKEKKTILICSHVLSEVRAVCNTLGIISQGKLVARGSVEDVEDELIVQSNTPQKIVIKSINPDVYGFVESISNPEILGVDRTENGVEIRVKKDIREEIAKELDGNCCGITEMYLDRPGLEDLFLKVYRRE
ncbi:ABC-2 type transport system ATP-binding protein [Methanomicrobium sp. W14]|uniref:ABC transporter ATP-binding protein n=1 Tax=Methanomicrobium sp. W14 TaxID=2817839 RepID=UPI001AE6B148|nr:ABC transporter ATP-binding protein [Methanomicrobium sp. W14]MBP2132827.1 ABC-2 type transport system ATP-binding protein [Methanomicrobium sp. W14]